MTSTQILRYLIENNDTLVLGTCSSQGKPWVSPLGYAYDEKYNLYWVSDKNALHSENIRQNSSVAITIFGPIPPAGETDGLYAEAEAFELNDSADVQDALKVYAKLEQPEKWQIKNITDLQGDNNWRIYKSTLINVSKRIDVVDPDSNQSVTTRESAEL